MSNPTHPHSFEGRGPCGGSERLQNAIRRACRRRSLDSIPKARSSHRSRSPGNELPRCRVVAAISPRSTDTCVCQPSGPRRWRRIAQLLVAALAPSRTSFLSSTSNVPTLSQIIRGVLRIDFSLPPTHAGQTPHRHARADMASAFEVAPARTKPASQRGPGLAGQQRLGHVARRGGRENEHVACAP